MQEKFLELCAEGNLPEIKKIIEKSSKEEIIEILRAGDEKKKFKAFATTVSREHFETLKYLWSICPDELKPEMLKANEFSAFHTAIFYENTEIINFLWSIYPENLKAEMLKAKDFKAFYEASSGRNSEIIKFIWSICPKDLKAEMVKATIFKALPAAASVGNLETLEFLMSICPNDLKVAVLKNNGFEVFRDAATHPYDENIRYLVVKYIWSICPDDQKTEMLKARNFEGMREAAKPGYSKTFKYLMSVCPDELKAEMLKSQDFEVFRKAAEEKDYDTLEYLFGVADKDLREKALLKLDESDRQIVMQRLGQREEILRVDPNFDIDSFNSLFNRITHNKDFARVLISSKKPETSTAFPTELFYEIAGFTVGKNVHKPLIKDVVEAVASSIGKGDSMRSPEFLVKARQHVLKHKLEPEQNSGKSR